MRQFCQNYTILWAIKVNKIPFFPIFHEKIDAFMNIFCKKRPFSKKYNALMPIFCQKNVHSLLNTVLSCHLFYEKPPGAMPIFGPKKLFSPFFLEKSRYPHTHILSKNVNFLKKTALMPIFCQKSPFSKK